MKVSIMQPYFFPYIGYFQMVNAADIFVFYDDVQFIQRGWINRNYIISKEDKLLFTVPLQKYNLDSKINEVFVDANDKWKDVFIKTITMTYKKAPFYEDVLPLIEKTINCNSKYISSLAIQSIVNTFDYLQIEKSFYTSSEIDYSRGERIGQINSILQKFDSSQFILPPGSKELYSKDQFNIKTDFLIPSKDIKYQQFKNNLFKANLSFIDVLMFCSKTQIFDLLTQYSLE
jgi:hypothetical protein